MKPLYSAHQFLIAGCHDKLPVECYHCGCTFFTTKAAVIASVQKPSKTAIKFCSIPCFGKYRVTTLSYPCDNCGKLAHRPPSQAKRGRHVFCSRSCSATYSNAHKKTGTRTSKLEGWLQVKLKELYPNLLFVFNGKEAINSELDIYIPALKLAFELNGIFHYEPIYGADKLSKIKNNDDRKMQACLEQGIELCILDTSQLKYLKDDKAIPYLKIITTIVTRKLAGSAYLV
jgi:hypothetical protein